MMIDQDYSVPLGPHEEENHAHASLMALLAALGIVEVTYYLSGGGDSGDCALERVLYCDGRSETRLPVMPIGFYDNGNIQLLEATLERIASDWPEGDWCNNEGGHGSVSFFPTETPRVLCDMTYGEEDEDCDDEDFEDIFDEFDPPDEEAPDAAEMVSIPSDLSLEGVDP